MIVLPQSKLIDRPEYTPDMTQFQWPAKHAIWLRREEMGKTTRAASWWSDNNTTGIYRAFAYQPERLLRERGLLLSSTMISDHAGAGYEAALREAVSSSQSIEAAECNGPRY